MQILTLLKKDIQLEIRRQHAFYGLLLYIAVTVFVLYLSVPVIEDAAVWNGVFWTIQLFIGVTAIAKSFLSESRGLMLYYHSICSPVAFIIAKLIYNVLLMAVMSAISLLLFNIFLDSPVLYAGRFFLIVILGGTGISMTFTLMSAIAAKAQQNAALMAILGFPVLIPQIMLLIRLSKAAFGEVFRDGALLQLYGLTAALDIAVITLAVILFPFLWKD